MSAAINEIQEIPAALPIAETEDERGKLLEQAFEETPPDDVSSAEIEDEEETDEIIQREKPSKKKLFLTFVGCIFGFVLLLGVLSWFFGIGIFAATKTQAVDRTAKNNSSQTAPVTEDEKLKMALNLVAEKNPNASNDRAINSDADSVINLNTDASGTIPPVKAADLSEPVVVPDTLSGSNPVSANASTNYSNSRASQTQNSRSSEENQNLSNSGKINPLISQSNRNGETAPFGRSLFFGIERKNTSEKNVNLSANTQLISKNETVNFTNAGAQPAIPFGTLLPIRFLGAVYTLRASGGLVRMELTRGISGKNYSYPAGTVLVGTLRGSEYKRAFVSVVGLIDPNSGGLVKFEGEVMGGDGASGIIGRRRKVKSAWERVFLGLREAGTVALGAINGRRSGGAAVIISDSASKASGVLTDELSGLINNKNSGEFVEIAAGTTGFVLVTDLPDEVSKTDALRQDSKSATGLGEDELAELFSSGSKEKIRAALPRMTPAFRKLAENALAAMENE